MARVKEFDPAQALDRALEVFWDRGYESASMQELCLGMGINRGSLYDTFGDKEALFVACLDRFRQLQEQRLYRILEQEDIRPRRRLELFFAAAAELSLDHISRGRGCFMANTTLGPAVKLPSVYERVKQYQIYTEKALLSFLEDAGGKGALREGIQLQEAARFLLAFKQGVYVIGRASLGKEMLEDACRMAVNAVF